MPVGPQASESIILLTLRDYSLGVIASAPAAQRSTNVWQCSQRSGQVRFHCIVMTENSTFQAEQALCLWLMEITSCQPNTHLMAPNTG
jgi:hypothetical protein